MQQQQQQIKEPEYQRVKQYVINKTRLICGGLIGISVLIVQAFIQIGVFTPTKELDWFAFLSVLFFAGSLPLLTVRFLFTFEEISRKFTIKHKRDFEILYWLGTFLACIGIDLAFWHIYWIVGLIISISTGIGFWVYTSYANKLFDLDKDLAEGKLKEGKTTNIKEEEGS